MGYQSVAAPQQNEAYGSDYLDNSGTYNLAGSYKMNQQPSFGDDLN